MATTILDYLRSTKMEKAVFQGAESRIYIDEYLGRTMLIKERFKKEYRVSDLDNYLTRERIKAECRNNIRCKQAGIRTPAIYFVDINKRRIYMEYFEKAIVLKAYIQDVEKNLENSDCNEDEENKLIQISNNIGQLIAKMHMNNIIHGDLTTSNFLMVQESEDKIADLVLIDFGLSQPEGNDEDKAVDLYVLERALLSTHSYTEKMFTNILESYCRVYGAKSKEVLKKFGEVRTRGRKRTMVG